MVSNSYLSSSKKRKRSSDQVTRAKSKGKSKSATSNRYDEEISGGSDSDDEPGNVSVDSKSDEELDSDNLSSEKELADENAADKRRELAKQYLENLKNDAMGEYDYDAQDLDNDIVALRLQKDVAENKGWVFKFLASDLESQFEQLKHTTTRIGSKNLTSAAMCYPFLYTVSKDMELIKWDISKINSTSSKKPMRIRHVKGGPKFNNTNNDPSKNGHCDEILSVAASPDGKFVVTGGRDERLIIWSTEQLSCLKVLETRSTPLSMEFRRGTDQLYVSCSDLKVRTFSINQFAQLEILYGHQDEITDISTLAKETCVSVGSRDKTAMYWKIAEETRLTFRGGETERKKRHKSKNASKYSDTENSNDNENLEPFFAEGSIDCVSMIDDSHFVTGSDNGNISLWSLAKKKPIFTKRLAHGLQPQMSSGNASAEVDIGNASVQVPAQIPYWITTIYALPYSNFFVSGSWSGELKFWKLTPELRSFELIGSLENINGVITKITGIDLEHDEKLAKVFAVVSKEHKLGRWLPKIQGGRNCLISCAFDISKNNIKN